MMSDRGAHLRSPGVAAALLRDLAQDHTFALLAPSTQFSALCDAVRGDQPAKAAQMREWSPAAQESAMRCLANCVAMGTAQQEIELWKVTKTGRELRCVAR